jgi:hypothetical protein
VALITSNNNLYTDRYLKYQLVFDKPIGIWHTNLYLTNLLVFEIPIAFLSASIWDTILQIGIWDTILQIGIWDTK